MGRDSLPLDNAWLRFRSFGTRLMLGLYERQPREYYYYLIVRFFYW